MFKIISFFILFLSIIQVSVGDDLKLNNTAWNDEKFLDEGSVKRKLKADEQHQEEVERDIRRSESESAYDETKNKDKDEDK